MLKPNVSAVLLVSLWLAAGCGSREDSHAVQPADRPVDSVATRATGSTASMGAPRPRIVFLGDSLTAGLGLAATDAYPSLLQKRLVSEGFNYEVVNAGVSGDTSAGGLSRLDWALDGDVRILIVALGGNDGLRGLPASELKQNLAAIIERAQARHIAVLLAGMEAPPNFGRDYVVKFHQVYPALAGQYHVALVPFLLEGVAGKDTLNQRDGIHPTEEGAKIVADNIWIALKPIVSIHP
jgi:acyl-CoA thioesterase-1